MKYTLLLALTTLMSVSAMKQLPPLHSYERDVVIWGRAVADELRELVRQDRIIMRAEYGIQDFE
jgi:hypothetical protein